MKYVAQVRQQALDAAYQRHPERFSKGKPTVALPPKEVFINPIPENADQHTIETGVNFPTLPRVRDPVCQHNAEPSDFKITYKSGRI